MEDQAFSVEVLVFATVLAIYILFAYFITRHQFTFIHESTVAIFLGFLTALFLKLVFQKEVTFSSDFFFSLLLPPIVFSVGYSIKKPQFFQHFLTIMFFGTISTILTIVMQTSLLAFLNEAFFEDLSAKDVLLVTIITSSSDPITGLALLKSNSHTLNAMVSGESVLNCAVAIILFQTVSALNFGSNSFEASVVLTILADFAYIFVCSLFLGVAFGLGLSYLFKRVESFTEYPIKETSLILLTGYVVYLIGQFLGLSGILALFTTAIIFSKYGANNLSKESRQGTILAFDSIRYIFQAFIFAYLGASLLTMKLKWSAVGMSFVILLFIPVIRFLSVSVLPLIYKLTGRPFPLARAERKFFWYTGLIRGIIAFALSLQIVSPNKSYLRTVSFMVVIFTTVVGSTFLNKFCELIGLGYIGLMKTGQVRQEDKQIELVPSTKYGMIGVIDQVKQREAPAQSDRLQLIEEKYIKPLFTRQSPTNQGKESRHSHIEQ